MHQTAPYTASQIRSPACSHHEFVRAFALWLALPLCAHAAPGQGRTVRVSAGDIERSATTASVGLTLPDELRKRAERRGVECRVRRDGKQIAAQATWDATAEQLRVHWLVDELQAGAVLEVSIELLPAAQREEAVFTTHSGKGFTDLRYRGRPVHRHVTSFDPENFNATYKPFLHVFDHTGKNFLTKGPGGTYSHHRGIFCGYSRVSYGSGGEQRADFWHCKGVHIRHVGFARGQPTGRLFHDVYSHHDWIDGAGHRVVRESRAVRTWCPRPDKTILDCTTTLQSVGEHPVVLDGDPQHAGFQFRAAQEVHRNSKDTVYLRPESAAKKGNDVWTNCPWVLCRFVIGAQKVAVIYMSAQSNPRPARMSTRPYARFGEFCKLRLTPGETLTMHYRIVVFDESERTPVTAKAAQALYDDYCHPLLGKLKVE